MYLWPNGVYQTLNMLYSITTRENEIASGYVNVFVVIVALVI